MKTNNTEQLTLNFDNVDNYRKGKHLNQKALQTGAPKGTFSLGDPHPDVEGVFFGEWRGTWNVKERWVDAESRRQRNSIDQTKLQTKQPKGTFRQGDPHPTLAGFFYMSWRKDSLSPERWADRRKLERKNFTIKLYQKTEKRIAYNKQWKKEKVGWHAYYANKYRAQSKNAEVPLTKEQESEIKQIYAHAARVSKKLQMRFEVDHIIPFAKGGKHHPLNLQVVPCRWNRRKHNKHSEAWQGL
jgi:hypothetical protein